MDPVNWNQLPDTAVINIFSYLLHKHRAQASSTCKRWRDCYFHPSFWRHMDITLTIKTGCEPARSILEKCGKFVHELTLTVRRPDHWISCGWRYDRALDSVPSSTTSEGKPYELRPDDLPKYKSLYQEIPKTLDGLKGNQGLEKLIFVLFPQDEDCKCALALDEEFDSKITKSLMTVILGTSKLKYLALGHGISTSSQPQFLKELAEKFAKQLQVLHLPTFQGTTENLLTDNATLLMNLSRFNALSVLTLNMAFITDGLLQKLSTSEPSSLRQLNMITGLGNDTIAWSTDASWGKLSRLCPDIQVTASVVISDDCTMDDLSDKLLPSIPLTSLRVLVCYPSSLKAELIDTVAKNYHSTLKKLELHSDRAVPLFGDDTEEDPLVMLCWKCKKLKHLIVSGYKLLACNMEAVALLRGPSLAVFEVENDLICHDCELLNDETPTSYDSLSSENTGSFTLRIEEKIREVSKSLKRPWRPVERKRMTRQKFLTHDLHLDIDLKKVMNIHSM